ncbi:hypothetical protein EHI8A_008640 [Entamoeba histolytica HM-1:IMSS-B]|uniref:Ras guanine nucleotide exchange factor glfB-like C-terminal domain-containing protein n=6 Tax=Entamoeba histolytica TaxID=5759 RepID=C4M7K0_ENTH1|nr:hypothetical protein EHI_170370 [Entamoeba histolytica HM-1:IMSS]EMD48976.1 Hypothetical protein EHI5A_023870 [Entamoeba histolytica KU27]EMH77733.1 hypothetical protein EHI8A_008640 [Entamoeba histolytica HM-1:IMSS-B]EMS14553.1 hypothetical protein KM1_026590 [Entamoeba histolytica HM-3:IMSS]ENY64777.1 hypothetical protein EHI7A_011290 [Entamoeba histolytica HM-1:IMSS-A]GAT97512.1 hypothetical protein CL6EHI_170370 [Entamoeba histolytica]|eukprot:XP_651037.1 hypothetical protein EHI_170370 [Entamoeba histolytica HM-1:IMSS]
MSTIIVTSIASLVVFIIVIVGYVIKRKENGYVSFYNPEFKPDVIALEEMVNDIKAVYSRPVKDTSVFIDIPRLAPKVQVFKDSLLVVSGPKISEQNPDYQAEECIKAVVCGLASSLDEKELANKLTSTYDKYFPYVSGKRNGDAAIFGESYLKENIKEEDLVLSILKTITQCMFASAVQYYVPLRMKFPYRDVPNGWRVDIDITPKTVIIKHHKREASVITDQFFFEWSLKLIIDRSSKEISEIKTCVEYVNFSDQCNVADQNKFRQIIDALNK